MAWVDNFYTATEDENTTPTVGRHGDGMGKVARQSTGDYDYNGFAARGVTFDPDDAEVDLCDHFSGR